ncbi:GNAT family N-acetyltransferase [Liquorilactobacillus hordei]|uniref:GNAT family N-acetyltransferase n=1 Tax=Liquorilactobacillus hordei TaxID=468911 RepID=A0A3Q8CLV1_9LACO|nr:GNAT family N-acetyltransferase [Liquorilactobacillus hordei]AUJ29685.1 GNAT family N-acetyltransferase [Liquorilactobacillus hordei]
MIVYSNSREITAEQLATLFINSGIHRPVKDIPRLRKMIKNASIIWTAWNEQDELIGVARAITDFSYACYLSDLAVDKKYQRQGVGKSLVEKLRNQIGPDVSLVLLAAQSAMNYYPKLQFEHIDNAFLKHRRSF